MFLQMLKDEHPEVRLHIISKLDIVNKGEAYPLISEARPLLTRYSSHRNRFAFTIAFARYRAAG